MCAQLMLIRMHKRHKWWQFDVAALSSYYIVDNGVCVRFFPSPVEHDQKRHKKLNIDCTLTTVVGVRRFADVKVRAHTLSEQ